MTPTEINEAVARKLGLNFGKWPIDDDRRIPVPAFCTQIAAAWEIVEQIVHDKDYLVSFELHINTTSHWYASFRIGATKLYDAVSNTAPMSICLAFLKMEEK